MRLSEYCSSTDIDRAVSVAVDSFVGSQKQNAKNSLKRAFAKYTLRRPGAVRDARAGAAAGAGRDVEVEA